MAQNQDEGQEKTLDPTPQRIQKARREGDVAKSSDLQTFAAYLGFLLALVISGGVIAAGVAEPIFALIAYPEELGALFMAPNGLDTALELFGAVVLAISPLILAPAIGAILAAVIQQSVVVAPNKLTPRLSRINPIAVAGQKFGVGGLVEFLKSLVKLIAIGVVLGVIIAYRHDGVGGLILLDARLLPQILFDEAVVLLLAALGIVGVIAFLDVFWQQHQYIRKLRMSPQEVKDEMKESEGDPHMKSARRQRARDIAGNRSLSDVPGADVVIVNPTHYAVALKWSREPGAAPVCLAKGVDLMAAQIRRIAEESGVPIHSDPPTARALYATVEIGDEISPEHYQAVAVAIRFADGVRGQA